MTQIVKDIVTWLQQWFYTESEIDTITGGLQSQITNKADSSTVTSLSSTVDGKADKTGGVAQITDSNAHSNIGSSANATQAAINTAIDSVLGSLVNVDMVVIVSTLPTASASTMNKIYCLSGGSESSNMFTEYITVEQSGSYSWEKIGEISGGSLVVSWSDVTNKPDTFTPSSHTHGNITNDGKVGSTANLPLITGTDGVVQASSFGTTANTYCEGDDSRLSNSRTPTSHASSSSTYGLGTTSSYGHVKTINGLTQSSHSNGTSLSAYQGYVLKGLVDGKADSSHTHDDRYYTETEIDTSLSSKADKTSALGTTITLVNKGETNEGCIIFNTIS